MVTFVTTPPIKYYHHWEFWFLRVHLDIIPDLST